MEQDIGGRLRLVREQLGLSQRQLARQSGVANATISQIEAGKLNPTVSLLKKTLDGIPMSLGDFFSDELQAEERMFYRAGELIEIAEGGRETPRAQVREPAPQAGEAKFRLHSALGSKEFVPLVDDDATQVAKLLAKVVMGEHER